MPIVEKDPWRMQYFASTACPADVVIPTDDELAWQLYPERRWAYDRLRIAESQGIACGTHTTAPSAYPVFCKPITNLLGMGIGIQVLRSAADFERFCRPGYFWMPLFEGEHISSDIAVSDGTACWVRHTRGFATDNGMFDYWTIEAHGRELLTRFCHEWICANLRGYTGMVNIESIDGHIIEVHLRFADQWPDLYGAGWLDAVVRLYAEGRWNFETGAQRDGYSVVLFSPHGRRHVHPPPQQLQQYRCMRDVSSIQITFHADQQGVAHAMPPGGFRLAIVNCWELEAGRKVRHALRMDFNL